jgi:LPXTG-site transpeptidase (sortase) family protein
MLVTGVVTVLGPGGGAATAAAGAPAITAGPVVQPSANLDQSTVTDPAATDPATGPATGPVQEADVGVVGAARDAFRPTSLVLWDGVVAPVVAAGVRDDGSLVVPDDPAEVGWWTGGAQAGEAFGRIVIAGHVDSAAFGLGVLVNLKTVRTGQVVTLRAGAQSQRYRIVGRREVKQADLTKDPSIFRQDAAHKLVLITCGGRFDPVAHRYQDNLIVEGVPLG